MKVHWREKIKAQLEMWSASHQNKIFLTNLQAPESWTSMKMTGNKPHIIQHNMQNHKAGKQSDKVTCCLKFKGKQIERYLSYWYKSFRGLLKRLLLLLYINNISYEGLLDILMASTRYGFMFEACLLSSKDSFPSFSTPQPTQVEAPSISNTLSIEQDVTKQM